MPFSTLTASSARLILAAIGLCLPTASCEVATGQPIGLDGPGFGEATGGPGSSASSTGEVRISATSVGDLPEPGDKGTTGEGATEGTTSAGTTGAGMTEDGSGGPSLPPVRDTDSGGSSTGDDRVGSGSSGGSTTAGDQVSFELCADAPLGIPDAGDPLSIVLAPAPTGEVAAVTVRVDVEHLYAGDLTLDLEHGGETVRLLNRACASEDDVVVTFDDAGAPQTCPALTGGGAVAPDSALSAFDGLAASGAWVLQFQDWDAGLAGTVREACVVVEFLR